MHASRAARSRRGAPYVLLPILAGLALAGTLHAGEGHTLERSVIAGGGGTSQGGGHVARGTIAQPVPGTATAAGAGHRVEAGYWQPQGLRPDSIFRNGFEQDPS